MVSGVVVSGSRGARAWGSGNESEREGRESFLVKQMGEREACCRGGARVKVRRSAVVAGRAARGAPEGSRMASAWPRRRDRAGVVRGRSARLPWRGSTPVAMHYCVAGELCSPAENRGGGREIRERERERLERERESTGLTLNFSKILNCARKNLNTKVA